MTYVLKLCGSALLLLGALYVSREYEKSLANRWELCSGFVDLLAHIRRKIDGYLTPPSQLLDGFYSAALEGVGYIAKARDVGISAAYFELSKTLPLEKKAKECLGAFFCDFGKDYREGTVRALDAALGGLRDHLKTLGAENEKNLKLARTLCVAAALGIIILLI